MLNFEGDFSLESSIDFWEYSRISEENISLISRSAEHSGSDAHVSCLHEISALFSVTSTQIIHASANIGVIDAGIHLA